VSVGALNAGMINGMLHQFNASIRVDTFFQIFGKDHGVARLLSVDVDMWVPELKVEVLGQ
jgi:hypothetical protein